MKFKTITNVLPDKKIIDILSGQCSVFLDSSGYVWSCGIGTNSFLNITNSNQSSPVVGVANNTFFKLADGLTPYAICALDFSSYAWAWGANTVYQVRSAAGFYGIPQSIVGGKRWNYLAGVSSSTYTFVGLDSSSYAWTWGINTSGILGINSAGTMGSPVSVVGGRQFIQIATAETSIVALDSSSYVWAWGDNTYGQLGDNTILSKSSPVSVVGGKQFNKLLSGYYTVLALDASSYIWGWGGNSYGEFGNNTTTSTSSPISVLNNDWKEIYSGYGTIFALNKNNALYVWGNNTNSNYGNNSTISYSTPVQINLPFAIKKIIPTVTNVVALDTSSNAWTWGSNTNGQLGVGTTTNSSFPLRPFMYSKQYSFISPPQIKKVMLNGENGFGATCVLDESSYVWAWGYWGGGGALVSRSPIRYPTNKQFSQLRFVNTGYNTAAYVSTVLGLDSLSYAWAWGGGDYVNLYGQLGIGFVTTNNAHVISPQSVIGGKRWIKVLPGTDSSYGIDTSSFLWAWGYQCGDNTNNQRSSPVSVVGGRSVLDVSTTYVYDSNAWTYNGNTVINTNTINNLTSTEFLTAGMSISGLGIPGGATISFVSSPTQVTMSTNANGTYTGVPISFTGSPLSGSSTCFLDNSSYAWAFGYNYFHIVGPGYPAYISSPVSVYRQPGQRFIKIGSAAGSFFAIDSSSYLWAWGRNYLGCLGINNASAVGSSSAPTSVVGGRQFRYIPDNNASRTMIALDINSYAWTWGDNTNGQILDTSFGSNRSSPTSVIGGYQWSDVMMHDNGFVGMRSSPNSEFFVGGRRNNNGWNTWGDYGQSGTTYLSPTVVSLSKLIASPTITLTSILGSRK